MGLFLLLTS